MTIIMDRPAVSTSVHSVARPVTLDEVVSTAPKGRPATSLADLYRKAKKTGVLAAFSEYPQ